MTTVTLSLFAGAGAQFFNTDGSILSGGKLYTYSAGSTTPLAVYTSLTGTVFHTNPIILDSAGRVPSGEIWLNVGIGYKFVLKSSNDLQIATYDNIPSAAQPPAANDADSIMYEDGTVVQAGSFIVGRMYRIVAINTTNFMSIGASSNTPGIHFIATGAGTGTGTAETSQTVESKLNNAALTVLDFYADPTGVADSTAAFQAAVNSLKTIYVPEGTYKIGTVSVSMQGCEIIMHEKAYLIISGSGIQREITQVSRATYLATNSTIDGYNYYDTVKVSGGNIVLGANSIGVADRIPFLQYIGAPPTPANPNGLQPFKVPMHVSGVSFILGSATSIGVAIHGGWGTIVENCSFTGYDCGKGIYINGDGTYNTSSQPQLITIQNNQFNSCTPIDAVKGSCNNSCEALNILGNKFNFVQAITLNTANAVNIIGNYIIFNQESMRIVDCGAVLLNGNYLQVAQQHVSATHECVVSFVNSARAMVTNNEIVIDNAANNRNGFGFYTNASNNYNNIQVSDNTFAKALIGGSAINFSALTAPYTFENINISNIIAPYFSYIVNFFNVVGANAKNISINNLFTETGDGNVLHIVGYSKTNLNTLNAPEYFQRMKLDIRAVADITGVAGECFAYSVPTTVRKSTFSVVVTNFVNTGNCANLTAVNSSGSIKVILAQNPALPVGTSVSSTADLDVFGNIG